MIDTQGNIHRGAGAPGGGQFTGKTNGAPAGELTEEGASVSPAATLLAVFNQEQEAIWERAKALRVPAVTAATALVREKHPEADKIYLHAEYNLYGEQRVKVEEVIDRYGERVELDPADSEQLVEIIRAVASDRSDLAELPTAYRVPGTGTFALPVPSYELDDQGPVEQAFYAAVERKVYDPDLAGAALREAAKRLFPDADGLIFEMTYDDDAHLSFSGVSGGKFDGVQPVELGDAYDEADQIVFCMTGQGSTGEEITGMRHVDGDTYLFDLGGAS